MNHDETIFYNTVIIGRLAQLMIEEFQRVDGLSLEEELQLLDISEDEYMRLVNGTMKEIPVEYAVRIIRKSKKCSGTLLPMDLLDYGIKPKTITKQEADELRKRIKLPKSGCYEAYLEIPGAYHTDD